ncbi:MAG TPA: hypothetical protein VMU58_13320 [Gaiellaceae bacterium]|nr:hypothetical protein [Gaiellaceae bacterium]
MADTEQKLRREVGAERERLVDAVQTLREAGAEARGKLRTRAPLAAVGALGVGLGLRAALRLIGRRGSRS